MFSFHKPKVYRSTQGCCICKAKSSSSRFTDSKKYETDFIECFQLEIPRKGEICNACVLLVKRFKRLPEGSARHWGHVVDARVGPGLKSMTKFKKRKEEQLLQQQNGVANGTISANCTTNGGGGGATAAKSTLSVSERFGKIFKKTKKKKLLEISKHEGGSAASSDENSSPHSPMSTHSDNEDIKSHQSAFALYEQSAEYQKYNENRNRTFKKYQRKSYRPFKNRRIRDAPLIDEEFWHQVKTCCGYVYEHKYISAVMVDSLNYTSEGCRFHNCLLKNKQHVESMNGDVSAAINASSVAMTKHNLYMTAAAQINDKPIDMQITKKTDSAFRHATGNMVDFNRAAAIDNNYQLPAMRTSSTAAVSAATPTSIKNNYKLSKLANSTTESKSNTYLHKIKSDSGKIVKNSLNKLTPAKIKSSELSIVKNLVKLCTDKSVSNKVGASAAEKSALAGGGQHEKLIEVLGNKFNDNSSDSGYEEILQEPNQGRVGAIRPVILANGIKLHVQPQNLVIAANLAGVSQIHQQQPSFKGNTITLPVQNKKLITLQHKQQQKPSDVIQNGIISSTTSNISHDASLAATTITNNQISINTTNGTTNLNQNNIVLIKSKYFQQQAIN